MSHDSKNGVRHDVWRCAKKKSFASCGSCAGVLCNSKSSMLPLVINAWPCTNATEKGRCYLNLAMQLPLLQPGSQPIDCAFSIVYMS